MKIFVRVLGFGNIDTIGLGPTGESYIQIPIDTSLSEFIAQLPIPNSSPAILVNGNTVPPEKRASRLLLDKDEITIFPALKGGNLFFEPPRICSID
tara:strand:+ start:746 stop:1033 length:288 start_codon:yes stop_codon:yes gene_type:complete